MMRYEQCGSGAMLKDSQLRFFKDMDRKARIAQLMHGISASAAIAATVVVASASPLNPKGKAAAAVSAIYGARQFLGTVFGKGDNPRSLRIASAMGAAGFAVITAVGVVQQQPGESVISKALLAAALGLDAARKDISVGQDLSR